MDAWKLGYKKAKEKAKNIYSKIGHVKCPGLADARISFSRSGFNHLMRKGRIPRTKNEQRRRFALLPYVENIIKNPRAVIIYRKEEVKEKVNRHGEKILQESTAHFWTFVDKIEDCTVKVVIRQLSSSDKHFFSVMGDRIKVLYKFRKTKKSPK
jgi:hypothetical protein